MRKSLEKASEKEWFKHFLYAVMVAEERSAAKSALIEMSVRNLGRQEYLEWARKFGLSEKRLKL
ncbi:MAG TPA: hypothetical protein HA227_00890 [Candidatus Diapherotrites archaeon]|nr:hypothetical protein [Candidatus Diapherotrites archaeon]